MTDAARPGMRPGDRVEVRNRFLGSWTPGFRIAEVVRGARGVRVTRASDGTVLPAEFPTTDIRPDPSF